MRRSAQCALALAQLDADVDEFLADLQRCPHLRAKSEVQMLVPASKMKIVDVSPLSVWVLYLMGEVWHHKPRSAFSGAAFITTQDRSTLRTHLFGLAFSLSVHCSAWPLLRHSEHTA